MHSEEAPRFRVLGGEGLAAAVAARHGGAEPATSEGIAEVARAELWALGQGLRWALKLRVHRQLAPLGVEVGAVAEALRSLEVVGDASAGPGGAIACAPLRAVAIEGDRWLIVGTAPTGELPGPLAAAQPGVPRRLAGAGAAEVEAAVQAMGGRVVTVSLWAGLDRSPAADRWRAELDARLDDAGRFADRAAALRWEEMQSYRPGAPGGRWESGAPGGTAALVRARQAGGWTAYAWARAGAGGVTLVPLTRDEALRARFAVDAPAGAPASLRAAASEGIVELPLHTFLPAAEYRYLTGVGEIVAGPPRRARIPAAAWPAAAALLRERLGLRIEEGA